MRVITVAVDYCQMKTLVLILVQPVADPKFSRRWAVTPEFGANTYYLARFLPKTARR